VDQASVEYLLTTTRSVRRRLDLARPVERAVVLDCLRLAIQAPTGSNRQGWRWLVIDDPEQRRALAEIYRTAAVPSFTAMLERTPADAVERRRPYEGALYLAEVLDQVPVLVIACIEGRVDTPATYERAAALYGSVLPAVWSFMLALRARGLGSTLTTAHLRREAEVAQLLGIPDSFTQVALLPVAYTIGTEFKAARRAPVETVTYVNHWGQQP